MDLIDLHAHSTASDGSYTPAKLVNLARECGLKALALTDHDTVDGIDEALAQGAKIGLEVVPGVEISVDFKPGTMHVLGLDIDHTQPVLRTRLKTLQNARNNRNPQIVSKLQALNVHVTMKEVEKRADGGLVGRPHFAKVMVDKGFARDVDDAFDRFLAKGKPAYVEKFRLGPAEALGMILEAGGVPVLSHPFTLGLDHTALDRQIRELTALGLMGLEVYYPEHTPDMTRQYTSLAEKHGLLLTGGTDFHGEGKEEIKLGTGLGDMAIPYELLAELRKRRKESL